MTTIDVKENLVYAAGEVELALDLYVPTGVNRPPVVVYFHGGGWQLGDKTDGAQSRLAHLASHGVAVASVNYRLAPAAYPAPIHDAKAAVRWVRARGPEFGLRVDKVGAWGASAGAYLAAMLGLTAGDAELEGDVGPDIDHSSRVDAVVSWFGPSDLIGNSRRSDVESMLLMPPFEQALLGTADPTADPAAWEASPLSRVTRDAPPFLISHGDRDRITPIGESEALHASLSRTGGSSTFIALGGAGHEDILFDSEPHIAMTAAFLRSHLHCA